jgi:hypothetical protein
MFVVYRLFVCFTYWTNVDFVAETATISCVQGDSNNSSKTTTDIRCRKNNEGGRKQSPIWWTHCRNNHLLD